MNRLLIFSLIFFSLSCSKPGPQGNSGYAGEKIIYNISPVGTSVYEDHGIVELGGKKLRLTTFTTRVMGFSDTEKIYSEPETYLPLKVERDITLWVKKEFITEEYDTNKFTVVFKKYKGGKVVEQSQLKESAPIHNAVLLPFYLRTIPDLKIGWSINARFPEKFKITLVSIEDVEVPAGKFKAYHFTSAPNKFEIWVTTDKLRIPVKIKGAGGLSYTLTMKERIVK